MSALCTQFISAHFRLATPTARLSRIKDTIDIAGYPTTAASRALAGRATRRRARGSRGPSARAGWRITGKTNMHELAFGMTGINDFTGAPRNPQDATRIPGGSSSGSASAVGLQLVDAALGTDTGGSIRGPAACCGVIGIEADLRTRFATRRGADGRRSIAWGRSRARCT